jgi:hypothetical protein
VWLFRVIPIPALWSTNHGLGGYLPASFYLVPSSIAGRSMWNLWWTTWHLDRGFLRVFLFFLVSIGLSMLHSHISLIYHRRWGTRWRSWLRHCATSRKVAGSISDSVIGIFHWHNPSGHTMAVGSTQPLTEMSTRNISSGVKAAGA